MLVDLKRTVAYICPVCSNISSKRISVFNFSGTDRVRLICPTHGCHEDCIKITPKNGKYKIDIECPLCGDTHSYTASYDSFWHKQLLSYKCPAAGIDIFFAGGRREVEKAMEDSSETYAEAVSDLMFSDTGFDIDPWGLNDEYSILFEIIDRLNSLDASHKLSCSCGSRDIEISAATAKVTLKCTRCGRSKVIEATDDVLTKLLNTSQVIIGE